VAFEIIRKAKADNPVQMPELKASKLLASGRGRKLIASLLGAVEGRYVVSVHDKLLALCSWFFEYIYEPVIQDHPHSILPDFDVVNPANRSAAVNALILYGLATRAERQADPYENLEALYHQAEVKWAQGEYSLTKTRTAG
jgi:hypothetical protein